MASNQIMQIPSDEMNLLTVNEINALNTALCSPPQPSSSYSDEELDNIYNWTSEFSCGKIEVEDIPYIDLVDFALLQPSGYLLQIILSRCPEIYNNINIFYYVYIRYTHISSDYLDTNQPEYQVGFDRLLDILIDLERNKPNKNSNTLLSWALNGERQLYVYRLRDEHNYIVPQLSAVKKIVPLYFTHEEALACYNNFVAATYSTRGYGDDNIYPYEKDADILSYLQGF